MLSIFNLKHKTMENLKNLVLAASQKVEMNGVTDIKKLYPDSLDAFAQRSSYTLIQLYLILSKNLNSMSLIEQLNI